MTETTHFDVIVVGGRVAGSTLAARLGQAGLTVLLLERDDLPSLPAASSPAIYAATMAMLDEIGADEAAYAANTPKIRRWVTALMDLDPVQMDMPSTFGRDYAYAIDRSRFDGALWQTAVRKPGVTGLQHFAVSDLLWDGERVTGVVGKRRGDREERRFTSDLVVGADGRFSLVARKVNAEVKHQHDDLPTTCFYGYWKNPRPVDDNGPAFHIHAPGEGYGILMMDSADNTLAVVVEGRAAALDPAAGQAEQFYRDLLNKHAVVRQRIEGAELVGTVRGMKKIGNLYRAAGGPGWALVGDAVHQKDPLDGQGIYDAVFTARELAQAILRWQQQGVAWDAAVQGYEDAVYTATFPMYQATMTRVKTDVYTDIPKWAYRHIVRHILHDEDYRAMTANLVTRMIEPTAYLSPWPKARAVMRGVWRDLTGQRVKPSRGRVAVSGD